MQETTHQRAITVSVVSHGQLTLIVPLLRQLEQHCTSVIDKVIVTLNIPEPDLLGGQKWTLAVETIINPTPRGFGANHNQAFRRSSSPWFLVLNPDIGLCSDVLSALLAQARPAQGLLAPQIVEPGQAHPVPERGLPTPWEILSRRWHAPRAPARTLWVAGMFMLLRREAYTAVGGFDEKFFMYCEDFDLCARLQLAGWDIHRAPELRVFHQAQRASHVNRHHLYWHLSSLLKLWTSGTWWRLRSRMQNAPKQQ